MIAAQDSNISFPFDELFEDMEESIKFEDAQEALVFDEMVEAVMRDNKLCKSECSKDSEHVTAQKTPVPSQADTGDEENLWLISINLDNFECVEKDTESIQKHQPEERLKCNNIKILNHELTFTNQNSAECQQNSKPRKTDLDESKCLEKTSEIEQLFSKMSKHKRVRKDLHFKNILRKCRKFYQTELNTLTDYMNQKKKKPHIFYLQWLDKLISSKLPSPSTPDIKFYLGALIYPDHMLKCVEKYLTQQNPKLAKKLFKKKLCSCKKKVLLIHEILYKFTQAKLDQFVAVPELCYLFLRYHSQADPTDVDEVKDVSDDMIQMCRSTLKKTKKYKEII